MSAILLAIPSPSLPPNSPSSAFALPTPASSQHSSRISHIICQVMSFLCLRALKRLRMQLKCLAVSCILVNTVVAHHAQPSEVTTTAAVLFL